jgi:hypothetical protein
VSHRLKLVVAFVLFAVASLYSVCALAHDVPKVPAHVTSAVVRVDAYEHSTLGVAIGDGRLVLVPFGAIEVARPGFPHAIVTDAGGVRHDAGVAATDRAAGLALLAVEHPVTATPLALRASTSPGPIDTFAIAIYPSSRRIGDSVWSFYPAGGAPPPGALPMSRFVVGGIGGARAWPIAVTPSVGLALGLQDTVRENGATAYDAATPSTWAQLAPGLAFSLSFAELRGRVRIPLDDARQPTIELGIGAFF